MMSKELSVFFISIKVLEVLHIQPEKKHFNRRVLHTEVHQLRIYAIAQHMYEISFYSVPQST